MKPERKSHTGRGVAIGLGIFLALSALCLLSPLRRPLLKVAGRETAALQLELRAERDTLDGLQARGSSVRLTPAERASLDHVREAYVATRERIDARERMNERFSMLGLFDWIRELYPWLLAFGLALPVLGGLIGSQTRGPQTGSPAAREPKPRDSRPEAVLVPPAAPPAPRPVPGVIPRSAAYVHPATAAAAAAMAASPAATPATSEPGASAPPSFTPALRPLPGSPVVLPPDILATPNKTPASPAPATREAPTVKPPSTSPSASSAAPASEPVSDWGFRHQPTPMESRPRPRMPPVRSPHLTDPDEMDPDENSGV